MQYGRRLRWSRLRRSIGDGLRHAFALDKEEGAPVPDVLEDFARWVVARDLAVPALVALESLRPLRVAGAAISWALQPVAAYGAGTGRWAQVCAALEDRRSVTWLCARIEQLVAEQR